MPKTTNAALHENAQRFSEAEPILRRGTSLTWFDPEQVIFEQGARSDAIFYLHAGTAKASALSKTGKAAIFALVAPGNFVGESCLLDDGRRVATLLALTPCLIERIDVDSLRHALRDDADFARRFLQHLATRNGQLVAQLSNHFFYSTEKRLARALVEISTIQKQLAAGSPYISQEVLAEMIGTTRSRVNFFMNKFRRLGLIEYNGKIVVRRSLARVVGEA